MLPPELNWEWYRGEDETITLTIYKPDGKTPQDISGWTFWYTAKDVLSALDTAAKIRKSTDPTIGGMTITDGPNGKVNIVRVPTDTSGLGDDRIVLQHDLQRRDTGAKVRTLFRGGLAVLADVTKTT